MFKLTVIIPVYGVEKYIKRCADSLFSQTLDNIEFIFINDCTQDRSMDILKEVIDNNRSHFATKHWTVRTERMPVNSGLPSVRRHGIQLASGDYIAHCDSDDWVESSMYKCLYDEAIKREADIVFCDYYEEKESILKIKKGTENIINSPIDVIKGMIERRVSCCVWNKLVRKSVYQNKILYPENSYGEDMALMTQLSYYAKSFSYVNKPLYHYMFNPTSISRQKEEKHIIKAFNETCSNAALIEKFFIVNGRKDMRQHLDYLKCQERDRLLPLINKQCYYTLWKKTFSEINKRIVFNAVIPNKIKLRFIMSLLHIYSIIK